VLQVARESIDRLRPGGSLLFIGGTGARRSAPGLSIVAALTAAMPALSASRLSARAVEHPHPPLRVGLSLEGEAASAASGEGAYAAQPTGKHLVGYLALELAP